MKKMLVLLCIMFLITGCGTKKGSFDVSNDVVPTLIDRVQDNGMWCVTFGLVWNDLKNELIQKPIEIDNEMAQNLNQEIFRQEDISEEYYYKTYGQATNELKEKIENDLKEKFDQKSEILDSFKWNGDLIFYTMLYRDFEFEHEFKRLSNSDFGQYKDIKYFGIDSDSTEEVRNQISILFYENDQNFAISIKTKSNDEVIMYKNPVGETFLEMYDDMRYKTYLYGGPRQISRNDDFKAPLISVKKLREYDELTNKKFTDYKGEEYYISKAIQTIEFDLDEKGGKVKSEASIDLKYATEFPEEAKKLYLNDTFALFLKEESKERPYFAAKIKDITKFTKQFKG